jgi:putative NIF3 family GTP cyclohydrolase 1 type 2
MRRTSLTRRELLQSGAATVALTTLCLTPPSFAASPLSVQQVLDRMRQYVNGPWREGGVDRIIFGSPGAEVRGIGTAMMCTFDVLKEAVKANVNLIITHEPTFWSHQDNVSALQNDPLYLRKTAYMRQHNLASYHLHDHWHALRPVDGINHGMQQQLGWTGYMDPTNQRMFTLPPTTLLALSQSLQTKLGARTVRVVGDPALPVRRVYESWGNCGVFPGVQFLDSDADVLVIGETQDWDLITYTQDLVSSGAKKAMIVLGHVRSEMFGMRYCAEWLKGFVPEVPVTFLNTVEPYWNLDRPVFEIDTKV